MWSESKKKNTTVGIWIPNMLGIRIVESFESELVSKNVFKDVIKKSDNVHENENRGHGNSGNSPNVINFTEEKFENVQIKQSEHYWVPNKPPMITAKPCLFTT